MAGAVFISYASQDADAARRICEALRTGGVEVWFDQEGGLEHGDAWDAKIRAQIRECVLFIPIISTNTQARHEGYFRIEWELAAERAMGIAQGVPFILPVAVDEIREGGALVPDRFLRVQWIRMPGGAVSPEVRQRLLKLWSHRAGAAGPDGARAGSAAGSTTPFPVEICQKSGEKPRAVIGEGIAIILAAAGWWFLAGKEKSGAAAAAPTPPAAAETSPSAQPRTAFQKSVAVLAFTNQGGDKENEYLSDGLSEEILNRLAQIPGLKVAARASSFYFKGKQVPIADVATQLGVSYVVQGSMRRDGTRVQITAQLVSVSDGLQVWSDKFDRELKDVPGIREEIAGAISKGLQLRMVNAPAQEKTAIDPEAFQLFLVGWAHVERASIAEIKTGIACLQQATVLSPTYAAAWAGLARANIQLVRLGGIETSVGYDQARNACARATALEPDLPEVLVALGWVRRTADWDWSGARQAFRRAIELQPDNPDTLADAAVLIFNAGQADEGIQLASRAADLDPLNAAMQFNLSVLFQFAGEMNKAEVAARRALQLAPTGRRYHGNLAIILAQLGHPLKAEEEVALETDDVARHVAIAFIAIFRNQKLRAETQVRQIESLAQDHRGSADIYSYAGEIYASLGESDHAYEALGKALDGRDPACAWYKVNFFLQNLHDDPRWPALLQKLGLADDQLK
jgi:TolB-like protein/tetratricopeptide (TPR) repeat protein